MKELWERIVEAYPDRWVALSDCNMKGTDIISGTVCAVCTDGDRLEKEKELVAKKITFIWRRTSELDGAYVL